jgi:cytochrome c oxidase subunit 3
MEATTASAEHSHGDHRGHPIEAHHSSTVNREKFGMLIFIFTEIMLFGSFFMAYFFIRVSNGAPWMPEGQELPVQIAAFNTIILFSSSMTLHWALHGIRTNNRSALKAGLIMTIALGACFLGVQINEYAHLGFAPAASAQASVFYSLTGIHGAHVLVGLIILCVVLNRALKGHYSSEQHWGVEVPGIYWHFVDVMWFFVFTTLYVL